MTSEKKKRFTIKRMLAVLGIIIGLLVVITAVRLLLLRQDIAEYKQYWIARAAETKPDNAVTYIALGDSAAQGLGASKPSKGYVGLVADELARQTNRPVHVVNLSVTGAKVSDVSKVQIPQLKQNNVTADTVVTLAIGGNDMRSFDPEIFRNEITSLLADLPPQTIVGDVPYFGGGRANKHERNALDASAIISEVAAKRGFRVAQLHQTTKDGDGLFTYAADFFHPSDKGYKNWYLAFQRELNKD